MVAVIRSVVILTVAGMYCEVALSYKLDRAAVVQLVRTTDNAQRIEALAEDDARRNVRAHTGRAVWRIRKRYLDGFTKSIVGPVVKVFVTVLVIGLPAVSLTPVIASVKLALANNGTVGVKVSNWLPSLNVGVTATGLPPVVSAICPMLVG